MLQGRPMTPPSRMIIIPLAPQLLRQHALNIDTVQLQTGQPPDAPQREPRNPPSIRSPDPSTKPQQRRRRHIEAYHPLRTLAKAKTRLSYHAQATAPVSACGSDACFKLVRRPDAGLVVPDAGMGA